MDTLSFYSIHRKSGEKKLYFSMYACTEYLWQTSEGNYLKHRSLVAALATISHRKLLQQTLIFETFLLSSLVLRLKCPFLGILYYLQADLKAMLRVWCVWPIPTSKMWDKTEQNDTIGAYVITLWSAGKRVQWLLIVEKVSSAEWSMFRETNGLLFLFSTWLTCETPPSSMQMPSIYSLFGKQLDKWHKFWTPQQLRKLVGFIYCWISALSCWMSAVTTAENRTLAWADTNSALLLLYMGG